LVGVDIGCGVLAVRLAGVAKDAISFADFDRHLRARVPSGFSNRITVLEDLPRLYKKYVNPRKPWSEFQAEVNTVALSVQGDTSKVWCSVGSLGSGNHYIELDATDSGDVWLSLHSGSRNFGLRVAEKHQRIAEKKIGNWGGLAWLSNEDAQNYLREMRLAQQLASLNRLVMATELVKFFGLKLDDLEMVTSVHNFIGDDDIIRKGAISARAGERVIIPWNMRDGLVLGTGKGNPDWNYSAPHGSGRKMARGRAKRELSLVEFEKTMQGIWSSCVSKDTLDESPMAYKDTDSVLECIGDTVEVQQRLRPVYNFKAGGD
jgi:RNA-splicing ligase RtcB